MLKLGNLIILKIMHILNLMPTTGFKKKRQVTCLPQCSFNGNFNGRQVWTAVYPVTPEQCCWNTHRMVFGVILLKQERYPLKKEWMAAYVAPKPGHIHILLRCASYPYCVHWSSLMPAQMLALSCVLITSRMVSFPFSSQNWGHPSLLRSVLTHQTTGQFPFNLSLF